MGHEHNHGHNHEHGHHHHHAVKGKKLAITILLNVIITAAQAAGGFFSGSLALLSDATHNLSDVIALVISWLGNKIAKKPYSEKRTFGYKRAEILAALINVVAIIVIAINIFIEGIHRFIRPVPVTGTMVIWLAGLSIVMNGLSVLLIKDGADKNINMKSAYIHLFSDMLTSIAVLIGGAVMYFTGIYWIDSIISIGIAVYLLYVSITMLLETLKILMEFAPDNLNLNNLQTELKQFPYITDVHHIHAWHITDNEKKIEMHIVFDKDYRISETEKYITEIRDWLYKKYGVNACSLQAEYENHKGVGLIIDER